MKSLRHIITVCAVLCLGSGIANAQTNVWKGTSDTNWQNSANWINGSIAPFGGLTYGRLSVSNLLTGSACSYLPSFGTTIYTNNSGGRALVLASPYQGSMVILGGTWESRGGSPDVIGNTTGNGILTIAGGNYVFTNFGAKEIQMPLSGSTALVNINSGSFSVDTISMGQNNTATGNSTINLNGGTLAVKLITDYGAPVNSTNNFNGGTLVASASTSGFIVADALNVLAGGAKIDSQAYSISIAKPFVSGVAGTDGGLTKFGVGTLTLTASNSYNGGSTINAGTVVFSTNSFPGTITFSGSGILKWNTGNTEDISGRLAAIPSGVTAAFDDGGFNLSFGSSISGGGGIAKTDSGRITLNTANNYNGTTYLSNGVLRVANNGALGTTAGGTVVVAGRLELANGVTVTGESLTTTADGGNFVGGLQTVTGGYAVWNGPITLVGSNTRLGAQSNATLEVSGVISGSVPFTIRNEFTSGLNDYGTVVFSAANNYTTDLIVASGNLRLSGGNDRLPANQRVWLGSNTLSATLDLNGTSPSIPGIGVLNISTGLQTVGNSSTSSDATLIVGSGSGVNTTNTFPGIIKDALGAGTRKTGVTVAGGQFTLAGTNTYTGPTTVTGGRLVLAPINVSGGGAFVLNDTGRLAVNLPSAGSLTASDLTFTGAGVKTLELNYGGVGNPFTPLIRATNLTLSGTVALNFSGSSLSIGSFQLIDYDNLGGTGGFVTNSLPAGIVAHIATNLVTSSIDFVVDQVPSLLWQGETNGLPVGTWDIGSTSNWLDRTLFQPAFFFNGSDVTFDDSVTNNDGTNWATLAANVQPGLIMVSNNAVDYTLNNAGSTYAIGGGARLVKDGTGTLTLAVSNNTYSSYTVVKSGVLKLAALAALPGAPLTNNALVDLNGFAAAPGALSGSGVVTNSTATPGTNLFSIGNGNSSGDFAGRIDDGPAGKVALAKSGSGTQALRNPASTYSGGTLLNAGTLQISAESAIGPGLLNFANGGLASDGTDRILTYTVTASGAAIFGVTATNGQFTLTAPVDFAGGARNITANSPVVLTGNSLLSAGGLNFKDGASPLTLRSNQLNWIPPMEVHNGSFIVDGVRWTNGGSIRAVGTPANSIAILAITNNAIVVLTNPVSVVRAGNASTSTATNIIDVAGTIALPNPGNAATDGKVLLGNTCNRGIVNLRTGGLLITRKVERDTTGAGNHDAEFNFDGGTLKPSTNDLGSVFLQGLTETKIRSGGAFIDTTNINLTIGQPLIEDPASPGGGLTKQGTGTLFLTGTNTYTGPTYITAGTLAGNGVISGPVFVQATASLAPGNSAIGTLTISKTLGLAGTNFMEINKTGVTLSSDLVRGVSTLSYGGTLTVTATGAALADGDTFKLFDAASYTGSFATINLPALTGNKVWDTTKLAVDGTIAVKQTYQISGQVALEAYVGPARDGAGSRPVTFTVTDSAANVLGSWTNSLTFAPGVGGYGVASYTLMNLPAGIANLSAKTAWNLRKRQTVTFTSGVATANFTGASLLSGGDINNDNAVDLADYFQLLGAWYLSDPASDIDGNGIVDLDDYFILASHWLEVGDAP